MGTCQKDIGLGFQGSYYPNWGQMSMKNKKQTKPGMSGLITPCSWKNFISLQCYVHIKMRQKENCALQENASNR